MQLTRFVKTIKEGRRQVLMLAFAGVVFFGLTVRLPVAGQELPQNITPVTAETPEQLQQLLAPIALYPDALVAQILAAATYPTQVVQADRWLQANPQSEQLAEAVDRQSWDPSVKALTAFPSVLANLDKNLSWTEALGGAYFNQQQDVLDAIQIMRRRAEDAGTLQSTTQEKVINEGPTIVIEPAYDNVCYLPIYDPWIVYGARLAVYPGYFYDPWIGPPFVSFGPAIGVGYFNEFGWGWPSWGFNWGSRVVIFNHHPYVSRSRYFFNSGRFSGVRGVSGPRRIVPSARLNHGLGNRAAIAPNARFGNGWANRGPVAPHANRDARSGVFNGSLPGAINRGPVLHGGLGDRPGFSGERSGSGGVRGGASHGGGSRGGGGGGRHR